MNEYEVKFDDFLRKGLFFAPSPTIRKKFTYSFYILCKAYNKLNIMKYNYRILDILLEKIPSKSAGVDYSQYF
jgi:hypothetical protein